MLTELIHEIKTYRGLTRKKDIAFMYPLQKTLQYGKDLSNYGDDAAVIPWDDHYLLLAADGIWSHLTSDPFWAGYCAVLVNINDIYAMGGTPVAMVNVLSMKRKEAHLILEGMETACEKFRVPMVGGHVHPDSYTSVAASILGRADNLMTSFHAAPGETLLLALDMDGRQHGTFLNWDSTSFKSSKDVLFKLSALPIIANKHLTTACKDISNPGMLGSIAMLLETSRVGALVDIETIPLPAGVNVSTFMKMYPGYGFILTVGEDAVEEIIDIFTERSISCCEIGKITEERKMTLTYKKEKGILFDFESEIVCGL
jgi:putative methanogenesis marker protein 2